MDPQLNTGVGRTEEFQKINEGIKSRAMCGLFKETPMTCGFEWDWSLTVLNCGLGQGPRKECDHFSLVFKRLWKQKRGG